MSEDNEVHSLLERQLRRSGLGEDSDLHDDEAFQELLRRVSSTYHSADRDRYLLERSLEISSTEMEELHTRLEGERSLLDSVLNSLSDAVILLNPEWQIQFLNRAAEGMLGTSHPSRDSIFDLMEIDVEEGRELAPELILKHLEADEILFENRVRLNPRYGDEFPATLTFHPVLGHSVLEGIVLSIVDISDRLQAERAVQVARFEVEAAEQARRAQAAFLASMSHELRTPLNAVIGYAELLTEEARELGYDELDPDLEKINRAGRQLLALINDVLDMSKIQSGQLEVSFLRCDVDAIIDEVTETLIPMAKKYGNEIVVEGEAGMVESDPQKLRQALLNIASNANKFTTNGTVTIRKRRDSDEVSVAIEDDGIGMNDEVISKIFEPFTQADGSTTREYGGTGLGLAITLKICQALGVDIDVSSTPDVGTNFELSIPVTLNSEVEDTSDAPAEAEHDENDFDGMRLLVIDDDPASHDLMRRFVAPLGVELISSLEGEDGIRRARSEQPDVIVVDIIMPLVNGWDVLERLKSDQRTWGIPAVVVSIVGNARRAARYGAHGSLTKPVERSALVNLLAKCQNESCDVGTPAHEEES